MEIHNFMSLDKKKIRNTFRSLVFERDGYKCAKCGKENSILDAHHITDRNLMPNGGYVPENGISLCAVCHVSAEVFHSSGGEQFVEGFKPEDLYKLINSSKELAESKSYEL